MISGLVSESVAVTLESEDHLAAVQLPDRTVRPEIVREYYELAGRKPA